MSVTAMSRVFWTEFSSLAYVDRNGKQIGIKPTTAKTVMLAIADNADDFGENSFQSFETLATKASIERRSVIRVVRALIANGYLKVAGLSVYGTNNYTVCLDKLGFPSKRRAVTGRPKTRDSQAKSGDSGAESGDSGAESGDGESPESSLESPSPTPQPSRKPDLVDGYLHYMQSPGIKREARLNAILSYLAESLTLNTDTKRWKEFAKYVDDRQQNYGQSLIVFVEWIKKRKDFDMQFWSPLRMREFWPQAFFVATAPGLDENGARTMTEEEAASVRAEWKQALSPIIEETSK